MLDDAAVLTVMGELLGASGTEIGEGVVRALAQLVPMLGGERGWLYRADDDGNFLDSHDACPNRNWPSLQGGAQELIAPWLAELRAGTPVLIGDVSALAPDLPARGILLAARVDRCVLVPALHKGVFRGFLCAECDVIAEGRLAHLTRLAEIMLLTIDRQLEHERQTQAVHRLTSVLDAMPELMFEMDSDGRYTGLCVGPRHLMAHPPDKLRGKLLAEVMPPALVERVGAALQTTLDVGYVDNVVYALDLPGGRFFFDLCGVRRPAEQPGERPTALFLVRDVTRRHALQSEVLRLRHVVHSMSNLVVFLDEDLRVHWANPAFEKHTGWRIGEIKGLPLKDLVRCAESDPETARIQDEAMSRLQPFAGQTINQDRYGNRYWVDFNVLPLFAETGEHEGWVSIETDVSDIKQQEAHIQTIAREAEAAHRRLENAVNALPDSAILFDADERLVVFNPAFERYFPQLAPGLHPGTQLRDMLERGIVADLAGREITPEELTDQVEKALDSYRQPHFADEGERPDGRWLRRVHSRTSDGGLIAIAIDITTRRRQIAALDSMNHELVSVLKERDEARRRLVSIMMGAQVGTWELDVPSGEITIGGHWAQILGRENQLSKTLTSEELRELVHPSDLDAMRQSDVDRSDFGSRPFEFEMRLKHKAGHWVWVMSRGQVLRRDEVGRPLHIVGVHLDISERKRLEREYEMSQAHLGSAMESSVAGLSLYDDEGGLLYSNAEANRILGAVPGIMDGSRVHPGGGRLEHLDGTPLRADEHPYQLARAQQKTVRGIRFAVSWPDGRRRVLACNAAPIGAGEDKFNVVLSFWDITEELNATETLERALAHAEEMSRAKSVFLANMSHEIRTPLNGVLGLAEVLGMQITDPAHKRMIASIRQSGETLLAVLNSILDMSKIEAGKLKLESVSFTLRDVCTQIAPVYAIQAEEKGLEFEVYRSSGCDQPRVGDPHRVQQILHNLLSNAIKFTTTGGVTLDVSCRSGKPVVIEVTDSGSGMTPEQAARAFDSFEQAEAGTTRRFGGTGLGLSIVRELVHMMGGKVTIDSTEGRGTSVRVVLPLEELATHLPDRPAARPVLAAAPGAATGPLAASVGTTVASQRPGAKAQPSGAPALRVLGADDNATNRDVLQGMLSQIGVSFSAAHDGRQAFDLWREARDAGVPYDVVLLDIAMPVMDGPATLELIRRTEAEAGFSPTRVVAVSGQLAPQAKDGLLFDGHLMKPFSLTELSAILTA